uniref:NADH dehydrogenase subunit 6 n=1 Tax=Cyamophila willieti TaxID=2604842 RepID=A0A8F2E5U0_9HEMI|nr:NADH dehydrogenase subunit 6 [Cyamophila willieti]
MIKTLIFFSLINSSIIMNISHPISFGITLFIQTIIVSVCSRVILHSSWLPLTLFLVMAGGLMILFLYITSICSNKKFNFVKLSVPQMIFISVTLLFLVNYSNIDPHHEFLQMKDLFNMEFIKLFLPMNTFSSNFMFFYLFIMLIIMIEILSLNKGPMRKKY